MLSPGLRERFTADHPTDAGAPLLALVPIGLGQWHVLWAMKDLIICFQT